MPPLRIDCRMTHHKPFTDIPGVIRKKPLQAAKFAGIPLALVLGVAGFFRLIDAKAILDGPLLGDGQFLALILIPVVSLVLIFVVFLETIVTGYRIFQSDEPITDHIKGRLGYTLIRGAEAAIAIVGVTIIFAALPPLFAESTPAPAGVGIMLLLMVVGIGILVASFVRSSAELFVYRGAAKMD